MTAEASCVLSVPQIIDVALNTPEVGSVNFRVLHALLHVLVQQIELTDCKVEFRGETGEKLQSLVANTKPGASITLTEYVVTPGKDVGKVVQRRHKYKAKEKRASTASEKKARSKEEVLKEKEIRLIERRKDSKEDPTPNPPPMELHPDVANKDSISSFDTIVVIEPAEEGVSTPHISVAVPKSLFDGVQEDIKNLKDQVQELIDLPGNMGLLEAMRDSGIDKTSPVLDMFQILNLTKRVDGTEMGINKLASMIEDLAKERPAAQPDVGGAAAESGGASGERLTALEGRVQALEGALGGEGGAGGFGGADVAEMQNELNSIKEKIKGFESITEQFSADHIIEALKDLDELREKLLAKPGDSDHNMELPADIRLNELENRFNEYIEQFNSLDALFNNQINTIQSQLGDLEKEIGSLVERINTGLPAGDASGIADQSVGELYTKIMSLQAEMENMADTANKLLDDKDERQKFMDSMLEQIEVLKTVKADKEDLEDALADKADACAVNRKVSHERFDAACDDLSRGIEDALAKLTQQETLWQQALDDIQREIGTKLDKMELAPLRDFVNKKLKMLQEKLKALAAIKKDQEAAGTKAKLLRNVNCISCDKDVVMRTQVDPSLLPKPVALPPARSMGPYLAYELDALRKQQKCLPGSRNLNHFENAVMGSSKSPRDEDHVCNRYCGGSHTTTTPQQRVTRLGHFLNQWGQDSEPVQEGQIRGTDGQMYKSRDYDVSKDLSQIGDSQTEAGISRPSMLVHSAVVTERQHSTRSTGAEGEARKQSIDKTTARKASADRKQSIEKRKPSNSKVTPEVPETPEVVPEETGSQTAPRGSNTSPPPPPPPDPSAATVQIQE